MQTIHFSKYQGTGNDFVMIDNREQWFPKANIDLIAKICDRRMGVGADGLILLENSTQHDFTMVYFNADGRESTMCGNGGRCIVAFAKELQVIDSQCVFDAVDGLHRATILPDGRVSLQMTDVESIVASLDGVFLDTGSPHHIAWVKDVMQTDVVERGKFFRHYEQYAPGGTNVNFVEIVGDGQYKIRTFERGVEDETLSCGTGATAVAIAAHHLEKTTKTTVDIRVMGGQLQISFSPENGQYKQVFLTGPAVKSFEGIYHY